MQGVVPVYTHKLVGDMMTDGRGVVVGLYSTGTDPALELARKMGDKMDPGAWQMEVVSFMPQQRCFAVGESLGSRQA